MSEAASGTQAVDRAALLVATVVQAAEPLAFGELAEECGLPKSTTSRLLTALERTELVERNDAGSYVAGPLFWRYAARHDPWDDLAVAAIPVLEQISQETGETVNLGVARGDRVVHVAQVDSRYLLGTRDWTQTDVPPHTSSLGKVLYAYEALPVPAGGLEATTDLTVASVPELRAQLAAIRELGYAATVDELELGLTGVAAPVRDGHGLVVAALSVSGPTARLESRVAAVGTFLVDRATELSALIGRRTHHPISQTPNRRDQEGVA